MQSAAIMGTAAIHRFQHKTRPQTRAGETTDVSEAALIWNLTAYDAQGGRVRQRLSCATAPRTNSRAPENRLSDGSYRTACRRRPTAAGRRRIFPQRTKWDDRRPKGRVDHPRYGRESGTGQNKNAGIGRAQ